MRVLFMGSPAEVISPLQNLLKLSQSGKIQLLGVVSQPARPAGRKQLLTDPPVATFAKEQGLEVWQPEKASRPEFLETLRQLAPDLIVTAAYGQILSDAFLAIPRRATLNIHPSLLPAYRGATPVPAALLDGCRETGVSILFTVKALDAGPIIVQKTFAIGAEETADALTARLFAASGPLLLEAIERLKDPNFRGQEQDPQRVSLCKKIAKTDGAIDWSKSASQILNEFRAYQPWPGSYTSWEGKRIALEAILPAPSGDLPPGAFALDKALKALRVGTGAGELLIKALKPAGSKQLDALAFWNGSQLKQTGQFL